MSIDFSKHPIYFFDDDDNNYDEASVKHYLGSPTPMPPIEFIHIQRGHETALLGTFEGDSVPDPLWKGKRFYEGAGLQINDLVRANMNLGPSPFPYTRGGLGGGGSEGHPMALVFDWDQTITLRNKVGAYTTSVRGKHVPKLSLTDQANLFTRGPKKWDVKKLARWYLHDPKNPNRIKELRGFFATVAAAGVPVFILTKNSLGGKGGNRQLLSDILKEGLGLDVSIENIIHSNKKTDAIITHIITERIGDFAQILLGKQRAARKDQAARSGAAASATTIALPAAAAVMPPFSPGRGRGKPMEVDRDDSGGDAGGGGGGGGGGSSSGVHARHGQPFGGGTGGMGGRKTRRRKRKKRKRRRRRTRRRHRNDFDKELKRVIAQHRRYQIARGDKRFKATRRLVKWSRPNKTKRKNRVYYRKRKSRKKR